MTAGPRWAAVGTRWGAVGTLTAAEHAEGAVGAQKRRTGAPPPHAAGLTHRERGRALGGLGQPGPVTGRARRALTSGGRAGRLRRGQPAPLALRLPPGTLGLGQLLLEAVGPAAGPVWASLEAVGRAVGLLQLAGDAAQLRPEGPLGSPALTELPLQLLLPGLGPGLYLRQRPPQPPDLWEGCGGSRPAKTPQESQPHALPWVSQQGDPGVASQHICGSRDP